MFSDAQRRIRQNKGFSFIELMVVMLIIVFLARVILAMVNKSRGSVRDKVRKETLVQLRNALQNYFDVNASYPSTGGAYLSSESGDLISNNGGNWIPGLAPTYISKLPTDPLGGLSTVAAANCNGYKRSFVYRSDGYSYKLMSNCAAEGTYSATDQFYDPVHPNYAWAICSKNSTCSSW